MTSSLCPAQREDHTSSYITHPWSLCLEKHRGLLAFSSNTRQPNSPSLHTSNAGASICTSSGGLSPSPARGNALLTTGQLHPKKDSPRFFGHLILLLIESFPNPTDSILPSFMSKGTVPILRYPSLPKDIFQRTREASLSDSCSF